MTYFETMNPSVEACISTSHGDELENENNMFRVQASFEQFSWTLVIGIYFLISYPYPLLHVKILLFGGTNTKKNSQMNHF